MRFCDEHLCPQPDAFPGENKEPLFFLGCFRPVGVPLQRAPALIWDVPFCWGTENILLRGGGVHGPATLGSLFDSRNGIHLQINHYPHIQFFFQPNPYPIFLVIEFYKYFCIKGLFLNILFQKFNLLHKLSFYPRGCVLRHDTHLRLIINIF